MKTYSEVRELAKKELSELETFSLVHKYSRELVIEAWVNGYMKCQEDEKTTA